MKKAILLLCFTASMLSIQAQKFYRKSEFGFAIGGAHYFGDLNQGFQLNFPRESAGIFLKYNFTPYIALKVAGNYAHIGFKDSYVNNPYQKIRNLSFENKLTEIAIQSEFNFFQYRIADFENRFTPYVTLGVGFMFHDPYAMFNNKKVFLKPLGTEGQNFAGFKDRVYNKYAMCVPIGVGTKYWLTNGITLGFELRYTYTASDYLDDVSTTYVGASRYLNPDVSIQDEAYYLQDRSLEVGNAILGIEGKQRGVSSTYDHYLLGHITLSFRIPTYKCPSNY